MIAFRAHKNHVDQNGMTAGIYNAASMLTEDYDEGSRYASSAWTPVGAEEDARPVVFSGQVWVPSDGAPGMQFNGSENVVVRIVKNGDPASGGVTIGTAIGSKGPFPEDYVCAISMQDIAQPGDTYRLYIYVFDADALVNGHPLHTFWCGAVIA